MPARSCWRCQRLARGREVVISRGQLVEIGGGFRIPDVLRQSGARLVEVGTTNRTHLRDFEAAIDADTALLLRVHSSNFKQIGFTAEVSLAEMAAIAHTRGRPARWTTWAAARCSTPRRTGWPASRWCRKASQRAPTW